MQTSSLGAPRCRIVHAAAWGEDISLQLHVEQGDEYAAHLDTRGEIPVQGLSLNSLLSAYETVDFLKMDVEGAEAEILARNTSWASKVRCLKVETHPPYTPDQCFRALQSLGFEAKRDERHNLGVIGRNP